VVETIFTGKERLFNRRFMVLANHYLFEPVACTPASGWEKGQVENQVGNIREWLFTPLARFSIPGVPVLPHFAAKCGNSWPLFFGHHTDTKKPPRNWRSEADCK
jgi:transposase